MATLLGSLLVQLGLESSKFSDGLTKAERRMKQTQSRFAQIGSAVKGALAGAITVGTVQAYRDMSKAAIDSTKSIERLAQVSNAGSTEFQKAAFAAKSVGVENEKLADIYKDVNDKVGDFLSTGGGEMKDFFEKIAPKVGVTAEQFRKLSGPDALQLYVSSLEKAGVNQQEMTFYMESIADEATALIPLLKDGGKAMSEYADTFDRLGLAMTPEDIKNAKEASAAIAQINAAVEAQQNKKLIDNIDAIVAYEQAIGNFKLALITSVGSIEKANQDYNTWALEFNANLRSVINGAVSFAAMLPVKIGEAMRNAVAAAGRFLGSFVTIGRDIVLGMARGIKNTGAQMWGALKGVVQTGVKQAKAALGIKSPSRVFMEIGDYIGEGLAIGIENGAGKVAAATRKLTEAARQAAEETKSLLSRLFPEIEQALQYQKDLQLIAGANLSDSDKSKARTRLAYETMGVDGSEENPVSVLDTGPLVEMDGTKDALEGIAAATEKVKGAWANLKEIGASAFGELTYQLKGVLLGAQSLGDAIKNLIASLADMALSMAFKALGTSIGIPGFAKGTNFAPGGLALVGERGPELVNLRRGSQVIPNNELAGMMGGQTVHKPSFYFPGITDTRQAREAGSQAALRYRRMINGPAAA